MQTLLSITKALSDRNRLRIVMALQVQAELCACQITELLQVRGATVSRHMGILVRAGLVESRREGRWIYFRLSASPDAQTGSILKWLGEGAAQCPEIEQDRLALERILSQDKETLCRRQRGEACCPVSPKTD